MQKKVRWLLGTMLIGAALVLLLSAVEVIPPNWSSVLISWQSLLIALGLYLLCTGSFVGSVVLIWGGVYFIQQELCDLLGLKLLYGRESIQMLMLGILLLIIGIWLMIRKRSYKFENRLKADLSRWKINPQSDKKGVSTVDCVFGSLVHTPIEQPFMGSQISVVFGGVKLDLMETTFSDGDNVIELSCVFGGVEITVPPDLEVVNQLKPIFAGSELKRNLKKDRYASGHRLIIEGDIVFGGVVIKDGEDGWEETIHEESDRESEEIESVSVRQHNKVHIIPIDEIQYIQSDGDYVTLCTAQERYLKEGTMKYFQQVLPKERFARIHRSYIVQLAEISSVETRGKEQYYAILRDGTSLRASIGGYQTLKQKLGL